MVGMYIGNFPSPDITLIPGIFHQNATVLKSQDLFPEIHFAIQQAVLALGLNQAKKYQGQKQGTEIYHPKEF
jgi:hypothetical protein